MLSGVPQGTVLGPLLFLTYININLINDIKGEVLYHPMKTDGCVLQGDLNSLHRWSKRWKMAFNTTKCHVLHITRNRRVIRHQYNIGGTVLAPVEHHPYLGIELDNKLCWKQQVANAGKCKIKGHTYIKYGQKELYERN